jgi:SM-20-related protein
MSEGILEVIDSLAPSALFEEACRLAQLPGWYFGNASNPNGEHRFWKMDLDASPLFQEIWEQARPRCEALAGRALKVIRVYANGHTYGLGGQEHLDDTRPGTYTLLYYPMAEWRPAWQGETVWLDGSDISHAILPQPNRAVFFDSRIWHAGRPPARSFHGLRVTVAWKLEAVGEPFARLAPDSPSATVRQEIHVDAERVDAAVDEQLERLGQSVRLPGFRPGKVPLKILRERYGAAARQEAVGRLAHEAALEAAGAAALIARIHSTGGVQAGEALVVHVEFTKLESLPGPDFSSVELTELTTDDPARAELCREDLQQQILDELAAAYSFPLAPALIAREFQSIWPAAREGLAGLSAEERTQVESEFRRIAERRLRLGAIVAEMARRMNLTPPAGVLPGPWIEQAVIGVLKAQARVTRRAATDEDWERLEGE